MGKGRVLWNGFTAMFVGIAAAVAVTGPAMAQSELRLDGSTTVTANVVQLPTAIGLATPKTATGVKVVSTEEVVQPLFVVVKGAPSPAIGKLVDAMKSGN